MKRRVGCIVVVSLLLVLSLAAQTASSGSASSQVPPLIQFSSVAADEGGNTLSGAVNIIFSLFNNQRCGEPLWTEKQNVQLDSTGHYSVQLGITKPNGMPATLFTSGEARWLGVRIAGQAEQPRVLLLSVPYALKAGDAATIGGLPPSAFVLAVPATGADGSTTTTNSAAPPADQLPASGVTGSGTTDFIPLWTSTSNIGNSVLFQSGAGKTAKLGINTITPASTLDVKGAATIRGLFSLPAGGTATAAKGFNSQAEELSASAFNSGTSKAVTQNFQWQAEPVGNDTGTTSGSLNLLFGQGTNKLAETGLNIASNGQITFATGQTFPGTGDGTITGVTTAAGSGLIGGGTSGKLDLSLINTCGSKQVLQWSGSAWVCANAGTGTVTSVGSGSGLTGGPITGSGTLSIATAGVSNSMLANPSLTISAGTALTGGGSVQLGGSTTLSLDTSKVPLLAAANTFSNNQTVNGSVTASSFSGNGASLTNVTAVNSSELGGLGSGAYAKLGSANTFNANQTLNGTLTASSSGLTINATNSASGAALEGNGQNDGVLGFAAAGTATTYGVAGEVESTSGVGVGGFALATTGTNFGVLGSSSSPNGTGVYGASPNLGVEGAGYNIGAYGVGRSASVEGEGIGPDGVWGLWGDTGGGPELFAGVLGTADNAVSGLFVNASTGSPTLAIENDDMHLGDEVFSAVMAGVGATATIGDPGCNTGFIALQLGPAGMANCNNYTLTGGVNGDTYINAQTGSGVHIRINSVEQLEATSGNINISGNLTVSGTKNFRIDHPLDPANKFLFHAAIESSEVLNLYSGNVVLDVSGEAIVQLPEWFEVINKDFRYQLTSIGAPGRDLYVAEEVSGGHFKIAGGKPGGKVSWQVSGVRNDAWEKAHPMVVEADKGSKRGQYLTPELYGAPETARIGYMAPAPGSEKIVHHRPAMPKRDSVSPGQRTPLSVPIPPTPVVPKIVPRPHQLAQSSKVEVNQK
ncbi:MAG: hypothetical protein WBE44_20025 [Terriglobales bacterium]